MNAKKQEEVLTSSNGIMEKVYNMLCNGCTPMSIRHEILAYQKCTDIEKHAILRKLHMEVNHEEI